MMAEDRTTTPLEDEDSDDYDYLLRGDKGRGGAGASGGGGPKKGGPSDPGQALYEDVM